MQDFVLWYLQHYEFFLDLEIKQTHGEFTKDKLKKLKQSIVYAIMNDIWKVCLLYKHELFELYLIYLLLVLFFFF